MTDVLLLINNDVAAIRELNQLAELMLQTGDIRPVMFVDQNSYFGVNPDVLEFCRQRGIEVLTADTFGPGDGTKALGVQGRPLRRWVAKFFAEILPRWTPARLRHRLTAIDLDFTPFIRDTMLRRAAVCDQVFARRKYSSLVLAEDNVELDTAVWIAVAQRHGVRSIILPYTMSNTVEFAESYVGYAPYQVDTNPKNKLVARFFPWWTLQHRGRHFLRTAPARILATELLGLSPPAPWLMNSGYADAIAVESDAMYDYCIKGGHRADQLVRTGSQADDTLAKTLASAPQRRREVLASLGLADDRPVLLCALPPDQNTFDRPGCEFSNFDDLVRFWGRSLSDIRGWNIVVRPHPKTARGRLDGLLPAEIRITYDDTATLVPICDLFVASISSTIRWAIACGKPVINYDVYHYYYGDYDGVEAVAFATTRAEFCELLQGLTTDTVRLAGMIEAQQREAERWGRLDGQSGERILKLVRGEPIQPAHQPRLQSVQTISFSQKARMS